jgi:hypothetical protein
MTTPASSSHRGTLRRVFGRSPRSRKADATSLLDRAEDVAAEDAKPATAKPVKRRRRNLGELAMRESRLLSAVVLLALGVVLVMLGWYGAAHTNVLSEQIPYLISGGLLGLGLIIVAGILAASAAGERETRAFRREMAEAWARMAQSSNGARRAPDAADAAQVVFVLSGGRSFHVAGCPLLEGKDGVTQTTRAQASSLAPCKLCGPD